jgi:hypothetical protein
MSITEEKPPVFKSWSRWYLLVLAALVLSIVGFYLFTLYFS